MLRTIFDSNIYGLLTLEPEIERIKEEILKDKEFLVYGYSVIRKELRDTPKNIRHEGKSVRSALLGVYDELTKLRMLELTTKIQKLGEAFYKEYQALGGSKKWEKLENDFLIVACGAIHRIDVVVSDDAHTLRSKLALKAYHNISVELGQWVPNVFTYSDLKRRYKF